MDQQGQAIKPLKAKEPKPVEWKLIWDPHARMGGLWMMAGFESDEHLADYMKAWKKADEARARPERKPREISRCEIT